MRRVRDSWPWAELWFRLLPWWVRGSRRWLGALGLAGLAGWWARR